MKRILLALVLFGRMANAQDEVALSSVFGSGEGINGEVLAAVVQPDGKILIGGRFSAVNGIARSNIARLNEDGTLDRAFAEGPAQGVNGQVNALAIQPDGGIIVGGTFTKAGESETLNIARYQSDGGIDQSFGGADVAERGANGNVYALAVQPDGKIVVGGNFNVIFGQARRSIARLNADGTVDASVIGQDTLSGTVRAIAAGPDSFVVAVGDFVLPNRNARNLLRVPER
ncbi:MAG: delta-60 repeat domain-containing protein [Terrimicrobiaceae bacterium]